MLQEKCKANTPNVNMSDSVTEASVARKNNFWTDVQKAIVLTLVARTWKCFFFFFPA